MRTHCRTCLCDLEPDESRVCTPCREYEDWWRTLTPDEQKAELAAMDEYTAEVERRGGAA